MFPVVEVTEASGANKEISGVQDKDDLLNNLCASRTKSETVVSGVASTTTCTCSWSFGLLTVTGIETELEKYLKKPNLNETTFLWNVCAYGGGVHGEVDALLQAWCEFLLVLEERIAVDQELILLEVTQQLEEVVEL